ncbi:hypothetical protein PF003_g23579 [Phytophthora fragariae]|nr:hypothetical protein PF003_g23579 [Phytophthora fragariae]
MASSASPAVITITSRFWNDGYYVVKCFMEEDEIGTALRAVQDLADTRWFRDTDNALRRHAPLNLSDNINANAPVFRLVHERMIELASRLHPAWSVASQWRPVELREGSTPQHLHRDFWAAETCSAIVKSEWVQGSVLVALTAGPKLITVPGAFQGCTLRNDAHVVEMDAGDLLIFRGDLPHANPAAETLDIRLEGTLLVDGVAHSNGVEKVAWGFYRCHFCFKKCDSKGALTNHANRYCDLNPDKEAVAKKRKANNEKGAYCDKCDRHFGKKNTYNKHTCI